MRAKTYNIRTAGQANIPVLGLGTWQSTGQDCIDVVSQGLKMGYEHIDTAQAYDNEVEVGKGIKQSGVARDKFFLTTKDLHLSHSPFTTCSFAKTVLHSGHQFTGASFLYARPFSYNFKNSHCVHL